jgi:hypothetical protein
VTGYGLDGTGSIPGKENNFSEIQSVQSSSENHPASLSTNYSFSGGKADGAWSWSLTSTYCRSQELWSYTYTPTYVFIAWGLINYAHGHFCYLHFVWLLIRRRRQGRSGALVPATVQGTHWRVSEWSACLKDRGARGSVVGWGTMLQTARSRVRFPMSSLDFQLT